jgi:hypothetical protein
MASIFIQSARIVYGPGYVEVECMVPVTTIVGEKAVMQRVVLIEGDALPAADWTDEDLCSAVALVLQVSASEVDVYTIPE